MSELHYDLHKQYANTPSLDDWIKQLPPLFISRCDLLDIGVNPEVVENLTDKDLENLVKTLRFHLTHTVLKHELQVIATNELP